MDYIDFINSKDIREHLRSIKYKFSSAEKAYLVWQSDHTLLKDKLNAFQYIIDNEEDCELKKRYNLRHYASLKNLLSKYIKLINNLIDEFYSNKGKFVFSSEYTTEQDKEWYDFSFMSNSFDLIKSYVIEKTKEDNIRGIRVKKNYLNVERKHIILHFNRNFEIVDIDCSGLKLKESEWDVWSSFEGMWFSIPTPFKKGDILTFINHPYDAKYDRAPFVLRYISGWTYEKYIKDGFDDNSRIDKKNWDRILNIHKKNGDITDMYVAAYFL